MNPHQITSSADDLAGIFVGIKAIPVATDDMRSWDRY